MKILRKIIPGSLMRVYHAALAAVGAARYGFPSRKIFVIGITGTNGKSTTAFLVGKILTDSGYKVAVSSSIQFQIGDRVWPNEFKMTMPGRSFLQGFLAQAVREKCTHAVIEVTSEGILQNRHAYIDFDAVVFLNLSREHIERHGGYEKYRAAKLRLFEALSRSRKLARTAIVNIADNEAKLFLGFRADKYICFRSGSKQRAAVPPSGAMELISETEIVGPQGVSFTVENALFSSPLRGLFNIENMLAAISVGVRCGVGFPDMAASLKNGVRVPGRVEEIVNDKGKRVFVDYAHTPAALEAVYGAFGDASLVCVLGAAGGGRDKWKRPELGKIAARKCRRVILTDEDPYDEDPQEIIAQIERGVQGVGSARDGYEIILDRREAIRRAINAAGDNDVVVVTGKGSESVMMVKDGKRIPWDDREVCRDILAETLPHS